MICSGLEAFTDDSSSEVKSEVIKSCQKAARSPRSSRPLGAEIGFTILRVSEQLPLSIWKPLALPLVAGVRT